MHEETNNVSPEVVAPESSTETSATPSATVVEQTPEANRAFAELRRRAEAAERELHAEKTSRQKMESTFKGVASLQGIKGESFEDIALAFEAEAKGVTVEEIKAERQHQQSAVLESQEYKTAAQQAETYKAMLNQMLIEKDFELIKSRFPDEPAKSVTELPRDFLRLMAIEQERAEKEGRELTDADKVWAYKSAKLRTEVNTKPAPKPPGEISPEATEKDYFTDAELDRLTSRQLNDPKVFEKAMRSMRQRK